MEMSGLGNNDVVQQAEILAQKYVHWSTISRPLQNTQVYQSISENSKIPQRALLPSVNDKPLWVVPVMAGEFLVHSVLYADKLSYVGRV